MCIYTNIYMYMYVHLYICKFLKIKESVPSAAEKTSL